MKSKKENVEGLISLDILVPTNNISVTTNTNYTNMERTSTNQLFNFESYNFSVAALQAIRVQSVSKFV